MKIQAWFDAPTSTLTYCVYDETSKDAVLIDPVWDYDAASGTLTEKSLAVVRDFIKTHSLKLHLILETHAHADHVTGAQVLKRDFPQAKVAIGARITEVQSAFKSIFNLGDDFATDGRQFDILLKDGSVTSAGTLSIKTIFTPGHTPACVSYLIGDAVFTGDALFLPDSGTGRCDFPAGSAKELYDSVKSLYALPENTRVFVGHDYQPGGRAVLWESKIADQKTTNIQLRDNTSEHDFVTARNARDKTLTAPKLLFPSIQINAAGGQLPPAEENGQSYLKIPIKIR
jgi:glyoxylase-like metal-dependent hydrolase (beta-lactamase superfamily II)